MRTNRSKKQVIGRLEKADFPILGCENIDVKIDTGAYTSAIHCERIEIINENQSQKLNVSIDSRADKSGKNIEFSEFSKVYVKSSNGIKEQRFKIKTPVIIGGKKIQAEFTLTKRDMMNYAVLIGRKVLKGKFIVDVSKKYIISELKFDR